MTDRVDINRLLGQMQSMKSQTQAFQRPELQRPEMLQPGQSIQDPQKVNGPSFTDVFSQAVDKVNDTQQTSSALAESYQKGEADVDITDVMVASQKASVSFQAMVQVRNKLIDAYRDVMNMPV